MVFSAQINYAIVANYKMSGAIVFAQGVS